jgi:hypothetical protein
VIVQVVCGRAVFCLDITNLTVAKMTEFLRHEKESEQEL